MDRLHRLVLQRHHMDIVQDLVVNDDFLGLCFQDGLFDINHIELIRAERPGRQQVHRILELLPRRGPEAFEKFTNILQKEYHWLVKALMDSFEKVKVLEALEDCQEKPFVLPRLEPDIGSPRPLAQRSCSTSEENVQVVDIQVKEKVEQFYHRCFGLNRKMSVVDKKAIEKFLHDQIILERQRQQRSFQEDVVDARGKPDSGNTPLVIKQWLLDVHQRLRTDANQNTIGDDCHDIRSINFDIVENQIATLLKRTHQMEEQLMGVYELFPEKSRKRSPRALVENVISKYYQTEAELEKQKQEIDQMSQEHFDLTMEKKRIEHESQLKDIQLEVKVNQIMTLEGEKKNLKTEIDRLHRINQQHAEKEKTLCELQHMVEELRESRDSIKDENVALKQKLENGKTSKLSPRRSLSISKGNKVKSFSSRKRTNPSVR